MASRPTIIGFGTAFRAILKESKLIQVWGTGVLVALASAGIGWVMKYAWPSAFVTGEAHAALYNILLVVGASLVLGLVTILVVTPVRIVRRVLQETQNVNDALEKAKKQTEDLRRELNATPDLSANIATLHPMKCQRLAQAGRGVFNCEVTDCVLVLQIELRNAGSDSMADRFQFEVRTGDRMTKPCEVVRYHGDGGFRVPSLSGDTVLILQPEDFLPTKAEKHAIQRGNKTSGWVALSVPPDVYETILRDIPTTGVMFHVSFFDIRGRQVTHNKTFDKNSGIGLRAIPGVSSTMTRTVPNPDTPGSQKPASSSSHPRE
jgi:hypothetical protein